MGGEPPGERKQEVSPVKNRKVNRSSRYQRLLGGCLSLMLATLMLATPSIAQHHLTGRVTGHQDQPLSYATVALLNPSDSVLLYFGVTDDEGSFRIRNIKGGNYLLQYSYVGMQTLYMEISVPAPEGSDLGRQALRPSALEEVTVIEEYVPITFKSDTVEYNAAAFTTKSNAVVEDLLKKIPGIEVDESGNMKAMGEDVKNVRVDGKEFFGKDPKVATRNLPAGAVDKVQVYDKRSDEAEFTGIDDGVRERTINLMLNEDHKKGYFGNVTAAYGTDHHYNAGGKIYRFSEKLQSALLGMANNINDFGYTEEQNRQFGARVKGENRSLAGGLNLSYNTEGTNRYFFSYLASSTLKELEENFHRETYLQERSFDQLGSTDEEERNTPHKVNLGIRHKFNEQHNLILDGDLSLSTRDYLKDGMTHTGAEDSLINGLKNLTEKRSGILDAGGGGSYVAKFNNDRTLFKLEAEGYFHQDHSVLDWKDSVTLFGPNVMEQYVQFRDEKNDRHGITLNPSLMQRIRPFWYITAGIELGSRRESLSRRQEIEQESLITLDTVFPGFFTRLLSASPALTLERTTNLSRFEWKVRGSWKQFNKTLSGIPVDRTGYFYILPGFSYEYRYRKGRRLNFRYSTTVNMPSVSQLYPVPNTLDLLYLMQGNLELEPEYQHQIRASWWYFDQFSFTSLFAMLGGGYVSNKISWSQTTNEQLITTMSPVNTPDQRSLFSHVSFSTPIRRLGVKISINSHENWDRGWTIINGEDNIQSNFTHSIRLRLENRRKQKWDAALGGNLSITDARYSISSGNTVYYNTALYTDLRFTPGERWNFETEARVVNYSADNLEESIQIPLLTAGISHYFMRGERATVTLKGYDLLNRQVGYLQISQANYLEQREWNTIGRYVMLEFRLRIGS